MNDRYFWRGRIVAADHAEAVEILRRQVEEAGYRLVSTRLLKWCPVQPWDDAIWFEADVEIGEIKG